MSSTNEKEKVETNDTIDQLAIIVDFVKVLPKMWVWILLLVFIGGALSFYRANDSYVPVYTASSTFTISIKKEQSIVSSATYYDNAAAEQMAQTFPYILTSNLLQRTVATDMGEPVTGTIRAEVTIDTNILTISVTDRDPDKAYRTLQSVIENYPTVSEPIIGKVSMNLLDETGVPTHPDNRKAFISEIITGMGLGLLVGFFWALLLFMTNRTIQKESDIKKKVNIACLGSVPRVNKKKRSKDEEQYFLLTTPSIKELLQEPFRMIKNKVEYDAHKHNYKTILITSATATEGKSLFATNFALSLVLSGKKVALIDGDIRHPTGRTVFGMEENVGLADYLKGDLSLVEYLSIAKNENNHSFPNFLFLPGGKSVDDGSNLLSNPRMKDLIDCMQAKTDYVIIDSAPAGLLTDSAVLAKYAQAAILVIRKDCARIDFITDALGHLSESNIHIVGGVLNDV